MKLVLATQAPGEPEIFASLQGEGASAGMPVAFIRLSRCNLACVWCDTPYSWHFDGDEREHRGGIAYDRKANQITLSVEDAAARVLALGQKRLVITGGEPLLQAPALAALCALLPDIAIEMETNGTVLPAPALDAVVSQYNVSPKLSHSGNDPALALAPAVLRKFASDPRAYFKFVVGRAEDVEEVLTLQTQYQIPPNRIFLMAEGVNSASLREKQAWIGPLCLKHGFRMSDRLHIHLYGDTRGS